ncbi:MAG: VWA domain-containing protein [Bacteroidetes bacterium RIFCSPLOWO2_12_FULL_31_6]|nr:MAG: VWA domain-containing protein [Bacteroidetes bacterium RIFCSPLOWO2_12_FULL_31_6]
MFIDFFLILKNNKIPVSIREYLTLLEALDKEVIEYNVDDFYFLSRTILVKSEEHLDLFDQLFGAYFKGIETINSEEFMNIPEEWLRKNSVRLMSPEDMEKIKAMGGLDKLLERIKELLKEQKERHEGGGKWIGTGGTSPFGAYGYNPEGIRIGQDESRHRRAVKVWDKRTFKNLRDDVELETRNMKMALKRLRVLSREGVAEEIDLDKTITKTSKNGGMLEIEMVPQKKNTVKVLLLLDIGGSMDDHIELCSQLFSAAKFEFKHLEFFYFHNCLYEYLWKNNVRRWEERVNTYELLNTFNSDYKVILIGDASMSPYEILFKQGAVEHYNEEAGKVWLERLKKQFEAVVWLNPVPKEEWKYVQSIEMIRNIVENKMFPLTIKGIEEAIIALKNTKLVYE